MTQLTHAHWAVWFQLGVSNSEVEWPIGQVPMDHLHYRLNFDLNKSRQKFHHSLKEHHKISNIPKFRCEML